MMSFRSIVWISLVFPALLITSPIDVGKLFSRVSSDPEKLVFANAIPFNNEGGHLQGVQQYFFEGEQYLFLSGSSSTYAYLAVAHGDKVKKLHRLMVKPFKHAGGFQIYKDWLAVGIEDNEARDASVVHIYKLGDPLSELNEPVAVIERSGARERATAGAVAIHQLDNTLWVVVGDWSNRHMDFYKADLNATGGNIQFHKTAEIDMANYPKDDWLDSQTRPYQNLNLLQLKDQLYLVAFAGDEASDGNVIDVFTIGNLSGSTPVLRKVFTRQFKATSDAKFRWAGGVSLNGDNGLSIFSCGDNIKSNIAVSVYR